MSEYRSQLEIDFGIVGDRFRQEPFKIRLDASPLVMLVGDAHKAHRVYELMLIVRPGDVWDYVNVVPLALPRENQTHLNEVLQQKNDLPWRQRDGSKDAVPFTVFDTLFSRVWGDDDAEVDVVWRRQCGSPIMSSFAKQLWLIVCCAKNQLRWADPLLKHITTSIANGEHSFDRLSRKAAMDADDSHEPGEDQHTAEFYEQLDKLLRREELVSVTYLASGDHRVVRQLAAAQRQRVDYTGHGRKRALNISTSISRRICHAAWGADIHVPYEGFCYGDLFIQGRSRQSRPIKELIENRDEYRSTRTSSSYILSCEDEGDIRGYDKSSGDGWWLYKAAVRPSRRQLLRCNFVDDCNCASMLAFDSKQSIVFNNENTLIAIGPSVASDTLACIAELMRDWQRVGNPPTVIVLDDGHGHRDECADIDDVAWVRMPQNFPSQDDRKAWLYELLKDQRWVDVALAIDLPEWAEAALAWRLDKFMFPWKPWVIATSASTPNSRRLQVDKLLQGDVKDQLSKAHAQAKTLRR